MGFKKTIGACLLTLCCSSLPAQWISHGNLSVQTHQNAYVYPFRYRYLNHIMAIWDPSIVQAPLKLNLTGTPVTLVVKEILVLHPPGWTGSWGGFNIGTRLVSFGSWPAIYQVYPWGGSEIDYIRGQSITLNAPGEVGLDYGTWLGTCCYGYSPKPVLCAMVLEVR